MSVDIVESFTWLISLPCIELAYKTENDILIFSGNVIVGRASYNVASATSVCSTMVTGQKEERYPSFEA